MRIRSYIRSCDPADLRVTVHHYPSSSSVDVEFAIESAADAFRTWRLTSVAERARMLRRVVELIRSNRSDLASLITRENGKLLPESEIEIDAAILELEYRIGEGERAFGRVADGLAGTTMAYSRREPLGVVTVIAPWNFPFNVPWRKIAPALMAGNTVVFKPASQTPGVGEAIVQLLIEAGMPEGIMQFVTGAGNELSNALVTHPLVRAVTFTGSTEVGIRIAQQASGRLTRAQLEMGGKNPMIILSDADLPTAIGDAVTGAYSCAGQWCTATSRLIVEEQVANEVISGILNAVRSINVGPGTKPDSTMGPVAGTRQLDSNLNHLDHARRQGAHIIAGGAQCKDQKLAHGCFIEPTLIDDDGRSLSVHRDEIFGPVLSVLRVADYLAALRSANDVPYGLSSSIYTRDLEKAFHFVANTQVGLTHVNMHSAYKELQQPFGGVKNSGFGLPEAGSTGIQFFQDEKSVYIKTTR